MTVGPWKPIYLHTYTHRITDFKITSSVSEALELTSLEVDLTTNIPSSGVAASVASNLLSAAQNLLPAAVQNAAGVSGVSTPASGVSTPGEAGTFVELSITHSQPSSALPLHTQSLALSPSSSLHFSYPDLSSELELWYPLSYGPQTLYTIEAKLIDGPTGHVLDVSRKRVGFRRVKVVQEEFEDKDEEGRTFFFEVNGIRIFCGGSNWCVRLSLLPQSWPWSLLSHSDNYPTRLLGWTR